MPLFWTGSSKPEGRIGIWRVEESFEQLLELVPASVRKEDPTYSDGASGKRLERAAVRALLQEFFPAGLPLKYEGRVPKPRSSEHRMSISHDRELVGVHIVPHPHRAGIDLQRPREEQLARIAPRFLCDEEREAVEKLDEKERYKALNILWCAKEALYKASSKSSFPKGIRIEEFEPGEAGTLTGKVSDEQGEEERFGLEYRRMGEHHLVHISG